MKAEPCLNSACTLGAGITTSTRARVNSGITPRSHFTIKKVANSSSNNDTLIRNGDTVRLISFENRYISWSEPTNGASLTARYNGSPRNTESFRIWFKVIPNEGGDFPGSAEVCQDGRGDGCWNNPFFDDTWSNSYPSAGRGISYKKVATGPASIAHDNCCLRNPRGRACGGVFTGAEDGRGWLGSVGRPGRGVIPSIFINGTEVWDNSNACNNEWDKNLSDVAYNFTHVLVPETRGVNYWPVIFGPFTSTIETACPNCPIVGPEIWGTKSEPTQKVSTNRTTRFAGIGASLWPPYNVPGNPYSPTQSNEVSTHFIRDNGSLYAPTGTIMFSDEERLFCASGTGFWGTPPGWFELNVKFICN